MAARILVIEDSPTSRELIRYLLSETGHQVLLADTAEAGLDLVRRERPDLILSDIHLPGMSGHALAAQLARDPATRGIPLLAVTASAMAGDREAALAAGFTGYLPKPIDPEAFVQEVARHLPSVHARALAWRRNPSAMRDASER